MKDLSTCARLVKVLQAERSSRRCGLPAVRWIGEPSASEFVHGYCEDCFHEVEMTADVREVSRDEVTAMEVLES